MSIQIIKRIEGQKSEIETIERIKNDAPQISYSSEGRITIRIPKYDGDNLIVFDRPLSRDLIRFIKTAITENPQNQSWCKNCATELYHDDLPF